MGNPPGRPGWFRDAKNAAEFLYLLETTGSVVDACDTCNISLQLATQARGRDATFRQMWDDAITKYQKANRMASNRPTPFQRREFLAALSQTGLVATSAQMVGLSLTRLREYRAADKDFAEAWDTAKAVYAETLQAEASRRAMGWTTPIISRDGVEIGEQEQHSDRLMERMLKGMLPETFGDKVDVKQNVQVSGGVLVVGTTAPSIDAWQAAALPKGDDDDSDG